MKTYWANLSERDRVVLGLGGMIVVGYLFYLCLYAPLSRAVEVASQQLVEKKTTLHWMQRQTKVEHTLKKQDRNLLSVFSTALKNTSFSHFPYQLQQTGEGHIQLSFEKVPLTAFLTWLNDINQHYMMVITELSADKTDTPGIVKLHLMVSHATQKKG